MINGKTQKERMINHKKETIINSSESLPPLKSIQVNDHEMNIVISSTKEDSVKEFSCLPGEILNIGDLVVWNEMHWIVTSVDFDDEIYRTGTIKQCNRIIKWQNPETKEIISRWCNATKPYTSNIDEGNVISTSNREYKIQLPYDDETSKIDLGKRFMLEKINGRPRTYAVTSVDSLTNRYEDISGGFLIWNLTQDAAGHKNDNEELMICDYVDSDSPPLQPDESLYHWEIEGRTNIRVGGSSRMYTAILVDSFRDIKENVHPVWEVVTIPGHECYYDILIDGNHLKITANNAEIIAGSKIKLRVSDENEVYHSCEFIIEVVSMFG